MRYTFIYAWDVIEKYSYELNSNNIVGLNFY
jgi:hypothetical protein